MTKKSNNNGRGYEYIFLISLEEEINKIRSVAVEKNSSFYASQKAYNFFDDFTKNKLKRSAVAAVRRLFDLEPLIVERSDDVLALYLQQDVAGETGDVRDIVISRKDIRWEIGLSIKHNHFAVKHSRLSGTIDFGKEWFGKKCSTQYWEEVIPIFDYLKSEKKKQTKWRDLPSKEKDVYVPLLSAFINEIRRNYMDGGNFSQKMAEYLIGKFDFYKIISVDRQEITQIQPYNLHGDLNKSTKVIQPKILIFKSSLPTKIKAIDFKDNSHNTVEMYMNNYWTFSFRIHNATTIVEPSLKFDVQVCGVPSTIITINCVW